MLESIKLFPPYLIFFTLVLVILPGILSCIIRIKLYNYLRGAAEKVNRLITGRNRGQQPAIVQKLEKRFQQASTQLESVNTSALIEGIYSEEKFTCFSKSLPCEQWDYFSRILPNLLLAFGLLGTFLGITLNLTNISEIIHQANTDNSSLVQNLQNPLQSMGIAFITSLIALLCSSALTVINLRFNTILARNWLISSLEDYLDNIFHPTIEGNTRLDRAVNRMVEQQNEFLTRFHDNVTRAVESSLGRVAQQIADGNIEAANLAKQVYERLTETSGTLARGATTFQSAALSIEQQVIKMAEILNSVEASSQKLESGAIIFREASEKIERSKFSENLENLTVSLAKTQKEFSDSTSLLGQHIGEIIDSNKKANDLAQQVYSQLQESSVKLQDSAMGFLEASDKIEQSQFADKLSTATLDLMTAHRQFSDSTSVLNQSTQSIASVIQDFQTSIQWMVNLGDKISHLNQQSTELLELNQKQLIIEGESLTNIQSELVNLVETVKTYQEQANSQFCNLSNTIVSNIHNQLSSNSQSLQVVSQTIEQSASYLRDTQTELSQLLSAVNNNANGLNDNLQSLSVQLAKIIVKNNEENKQQFKLILKILEESLYKIEYLSKIKSVLDRVLEELQKQRTDHNSRNGFNPNLENLSEQIKTSFEL